MSNRSLSRRAFLVASAGAAIAACGGPAPPRKDSRSGPSGFGVNIHSAYARTPYAHHEAVLEAVLATGASWVRDNLATGPDVLGRQSRLWQRLRESGVRVDVIVGSPSIGSGSRPDLAAALRRAAPFLFRVEGWNEPDDGSYDWQTPTVAHQRWLAETVRADPRLAGLEVLGPSIKTPPGDPAAAATLRRLYDRLGSSVQVANLHCYPGARSGAALLDRLLDDLPPGLDAAVTEAGWSTLSGPDPVRGEVDEEAQAAFAVDLVKHACRRGVGICFYELLDRGGAPTDVSAHFGLFRCPSPDPATWSAKPVVDRLLRVVAA